MGFRNHPEWKKKRAVTLRATINPATRRYYTYKHIGEMLEVHKDTVRYWVAERGVHHEEPGLVGKGMRNDLSEITRKIRFTKEEDLMDSIRNEMNKSELEEKAGNAP